MINPQIHPIYFPTTTIFVDDSRPFLENLSLQLDPEVAFVLHHSASKALDGINGRNRIKPFTQGYFSRYAHDQEFSQSSCVIDIDVDRIHQEVYNQNRFEECAVVVVDYVMPEMTGIEFCRQIQLPGVKKVLLTGRADEKLAVRAFNEGIIERFITKNDSEALTTLNRVITELQEEYFTDLGAPLVDMLTSGAYGFLRDPEVVKLFDQIKADHGIVEYYLCCNPEGVFMVSSSGKSYLMIICTEDDMQAHYEISLDQGAPQALLDSLSSRKFIPYFHHTHGFYDPSLGEWRNYLHPGYEVHGQQRYFYALVENPGPFAAKTVFPYQNYLDLLDGTQTR
jgi:CheY-like chemotaxis protein